MLDIEPVHVDLMEQRFKPAFGTLTVSIQECNYLTFRQLRTYRNYTTNYLLTWIKPQAILSTQYTIRIPQNG